MILALVDFKIGTRVKHEKYGEGIVVTIEILSGCNLAMVNFQSNSCWCDIDKLTIIDKPIVSMKQAREEALQNFSGRTLEFKQLISKMKTTEEETMQEFEPITKDNIEDVLKYNDWNYDSREIYDEFPAYKCPDVYTPYYISIRQQDSNRLEFHLGGIDDYEGDSITTADFDEFLAFIQKRIELKPIPKKPEFDFEQYLLDNVLKQSDGAVYLLSDNIDIGVWVFYNYFGLQDLSRYAQTKENADILIAAAKLLEGLK